MTNTHATGKNAGRGLVEVIPLWGADAPKETSPKEFEFISPPKCDLEFIRQFMESEHYSRNANVSAMYCFALVSKGRGIVGVAVYSKPAMNSIYKLYAENEKDVVELRRLVCIDDTPKNTESYFVGKTLKWLVQNTEHKAMVTYADPTFGHVGHAYRACNMKYDGLSGTTSVLILPIEKCTHPGQRCIGEGKKECEQHDRNLRTRVKCQTHPLGVTKDGKTVTEPMVRQLNVKGIQCKCERPYTKEALLLRDLFKNKIAKLVAREPKHRYHYHLEELRTGIPQPCRQCKENAINKPTIPQVGEPKLNKPIEIKETSTTFIPDGYIQDEPKVSVVGPTIEDITSKMEKSWTKETSYWKDKWVPENPALGQCAITALIVQDKLGGELLRTEVDGFGSHYYNQLPDGTIVDLTKRQFPADAKMSKPTKKKREDVTQYKQVMKRYELLKDNFEKA